jgi:DNA helicase-2/ATP-dependent DNA helicase PcrA
LASYGSTQPPSQLAPDVIPTDTQNTAAINEQLMTSWHDKHIIAQQQPGMKEILEPILTNYKLSITHLQCFTNIAHAGPQEFFLRYILRFPQKQSSQLALGNAVHATLDAAQKHIVATGKPKEIPKLIEDFANYLHRQKISPAEEENLIDYGGRVLNTYLTERYDSFLANERFEFDLSSQPVLLGSAKLIGKIDRITPLNSTDMRVIDFKTSRPLYNWDDKDPNKAIRLHFYKQQLIFYKLLLEQSKALGVNKKVVEAGIEFVIPDADGHIAETLLFTPTDADVERLRTLAAAVWQKVQALDLPDVSEYPKTLAGILQFEDDLINT